ncbi:MAG: LuxR C-terminal-related transcriptional regulator, partial [Acidimicrobiaceae bacterium]|nr:LuxR C-terminal-related transcriptional regulator [Acidimicrobiaceae bacterium]
GPPALALASAVAVLGDEVPLRHATRLAELDATAAARAADALVAAHLFSHGEPLRFVHPLIASAVRADIPSRAAARAHRNAARILASDGAQIEEVAAHLVLADAEGDPWSVDVLRNAAARAVSRGAPEAAVRYLSRAVAEPPPAPLRGELQAQLAMVEADAGAHQPAPDRRCGPESVSASLSRAELVPAHAVGPAAPTVPSLWATPAQLRGLFVEGLEGLSRDREVGSNTDACLPETEHLIAASLLSLGRVEDALLTVEQAGCAAEVIGSTSLSGHCRSLRASCLLAAGRLADARAEAELADDAARSIGSANLAILALSTLIESSVHMGDLAAADAALGRLLREVDAEAFTLDRYWATAIVTEAQNRGQMAMRALEPVFAALEAGNFAIAVPHPARLPQLVDLALRHGNEPAARSVVAASARLAQLNEGVGVLEQIALYARGLLERDVVALQEAYALSNKAETRVLSASLTNHLGTLEAEAGRRSEAVKAFEEALESFMEMGADLDAARVRAALRKLGVRKRHGAARRPGRGWGALTPAELSVVRVVGKGLTNRAAAEELFISSDTVNTHLRHAFTKLDIRSRRELATLAAAHDH